jgi:glycine cleavage system H protein
MNEIKVPDDIYYTKTHEWVRIDGDEATIGITDYAVSEMNKEIVYIELPEIDAEVKQAESFGLIDSVKASFDLYAPVSGKVVSVNEELENSPELVANSPYKDGWIARLSFEKAEDLQNLLSAAQYKDLISKEEK